MERERRKASSGPRPFTSSSARVRALPGSGDRGPLRHREFHDISMRFGIQSVGPGHPFLACSSTKPRQVLPILDCESCRISDAVPIGRNESLGITTTLLPSVIRAEPSCNIAKVAIIPATVLSDFLLTIILTPFHGIRRVPWYRFLGTPLLGCVCFPCRDRQKGVREALPVFQALDGYPSCPLPAGAVFFVLIRGW